MIPQHHSFIIANVDTDAISFCKPDFSAFSKEERSELVKQINEITNEFMVWEDDGYYDKFIVLAAKNYIMLKEDGELTLKGSSLKDAKIEAVIKQFMKEIIDSLLAERDDFVSIYHKYIKMASNITDIKPWCSKKTLSATTYKSTRANETKIIDAIVGTEYVEGDRIYVFFKEDGSLSLMEHFDGNYDKDKMYEKLFKATDRFAEVLDNSMFLNYSLKRNKTKLQEILNV